MAMSPTDPCIVVCDGLKGLPEAIITVWDRAISLRRALFICCTTPSLRVPQVLGPDRRGQPSRLHRSSEVAAKERLVEFTATWGAQYPVIVRLWANAWNEFVPFLGYDVEIRRVICSTNAIEPPNARYRRATAPSATPRSRPR